MADDAAKAALQKQIDDWQKTAARYRSEPETGEGSEQLAERAKHAEHERDVATAKYHHYELASALFQIGIVLASATIITGMIVLAWVSGVLTLAGIASPRSACSRRICCICIERTEAARAVISCAVEAPLYAGHPVRRGSRSSTASLEHWIARSGR